MLLLPHIFENMQEEGVSISIRSGWKPALMVSRRRAPQPECWCQLVPAGMGTLPPLSLGLPGCSLLPILQGRAGF